MARRALREAAWQGAASSSTTTTVGRLAVLRGVREKDESQSAIPDRQTDGGRPSDGQLVRDSEG